MGARGRSGEIELGFFLADSAVVVQEESRRATPKKAKSETPMSERERGCDACPLHDTWGRLTTPRMQLGGNPAGDILVLTESPSEDDDVAGGLLTGKLGAFFRNLVPHRHKDRLAFASAARCWPPGNRVPTGHEMHCCSVHLEQDVAEHNFKAVLILGGAALSRFVSPASASITQVHGLRFPVDIGGKVLWAFPIFSPSFVEKTGGERSSQYPCFRADLLRFFKEVDKWRRPTVEVPRPSDVVVAASADEAQSLVASMEGVIGVDIETSKLKPYERDGTVISAAASDGKITVAWPCEHPSSSNDWGLKLLLETTQSRSWVGHQSQFEFTWMTAMAARHGIDWQSADFDDSMALVRLYHARTGVNELGLSSRLILGANIKEMTPVDARRIMSYTLDEILPYNGLDAWASVRILHHLGGKVNDVIYRQLLGASRCFAMMELQGLDVDLPAAVDLKAEWGAVAERAEKRAQTIYEVKSFVRERQQEFNIASPEHVGQALTAYGKVELPRTPGGKSFSTDDSVLGPLAETNPLISAVLEYREAMKHVSTYVDPILAVPAKYEDGRLHPSYTCGMHHHCFRSTSANVNIQNWPKRKHKEVRRQITAPPGHVLMPCDSGQIQARVFGMASRDKALTRSFIDHVDIHSYWLNRALDIYPPYIDRLREQTNVTDDAKLMKAARNVIKYDFVFASFFGQIATSCSEKTGIPLRLTEELLGEFWEGYPEARKWLKARRAEYRDTGTVHLLSGQPRRGVMPGNEPIITAIQAGEVEFVFGAMNDLYAASVAEKDPYLMPRICVHDDLTLIVPDDDDSIEYYANRVAHEMTRVRFPWQTVPLSVEIQIGRNWEDLAEIAVIEGDYVR